MDLFYLGVPEPAWMARTRVPLFVSQRRLAPRKTLPTSIGRWALDSGGFSELSLYGKWLTTPEAYVNDIYRYQEQIGNLDWAAPQDWMCEPQMLARTGLTVYEHQRRTVENYLELRTLAPELPIIPVLQGWSEREYLDHIGMYYMVGVDLAALELVGIGSICRRQNTIRIASLLYTLAVGPTWGTGARGLEILSPKGLQLHGFGVKRAGLLAAADYLKTADSMSWSMQARFESAMPGHAHQACANCLDYALAWRADLLDDVRAGRGPQQSARLQLAEAL